MNQEKRFLKRMMRTRLIEARRSRNLSQKALAELIGTTQNNISRWELGLTSPTSYFRTKLCNFFGKRPHELGLLDNQKAEAQQSRQSSDRSAPDPSADKQCLPLWHVPYPRNPFFTARDSILETLHTQLKQPAQSCALRGLGGIGKTQLALEYIYRYTSVYRAILWVGAETSETILSSLVSIAEVLDLPERQAQDQHRVVRAVIGWLDTHQGWLLVCDNVEDPALIQPLLPSIRQGSLLLTTRLQAIGAIAHQITLEPLDDQESLVFLLRRSRLLQSESSLEQLVPTEIHAAQAIVREMGGLPLALDQAGAYLDETQCSVEEYLRFFRSSPLRLLNERDHHLDHPVPVAKTFILAFEQLKQKDRLASEILIICAYLSPDSISETIFIEGAAHLGPAFEKLATHPLQFNAAIKTLLTYSLVQRNATTHTLSIHRLVQIVIKEHLPPSLQRAWRARVVCAISHLFPAAAIQQAEYSQTCERLLPHALICIRDNENGRSEDTIEQISLISHVATYLRNRARYAEAESLFKRAWLLGEHSRNPEQPAVIEALHGLASLYIMQGKYAQAEPLLQQALRLAGRVLPPESPLRTEIIYRMGTLFFFQGKYSQSEALYLQTLDIWQQTLGPEHPRVGEVLGALAALSKKQERYTEAESLQQQALHITEQALGAHHPQVGADLNDLAMIYILQKKYEQADLLSQRVICIWKSTLGPEHPSLAFPLLNLADSSAGQGKYEQAEQFYEQALYLWEQGFGPENPRMADFLYDFAGFYREQKKYELAKPLYQRALAIREKVLEADHPETVEAREKYLTLLRTMEQGETTLSLESATSD